MPVVQLWNKLANGMDVLLLFILCTDFFDASVEWCIGMGSQCEPTGVCPPPPPQKNALGLCCLVPLPDTRHSWV